MEIEEAYRIINKMCGLYNCGICPFRGESCLRNAVALLKEKEQLLEKLKIEHTK